MNFNIFEVLNLVVAFVVVLGPLVILHAYFGKKRNG